MEACVEERQKKQGCSYPHLYISALNKYKDWKWINVKTWKALG